MPLKGKPETAFVFSHDKTWDYVCKACMKKGFDVEMKAFKFNEKDVRIKCPRCDAEENIFVEM